MPLQLSWQSISFVRRRSRVRSSLEAGSSHGLVGYDARLTRERSRVRASVRILPKFLRTNFSHPDFFFARKNQFCHPEIFFSPQYIYFGKKKEFIPKTVTPHKSLGQRFHSWYQVEEALVMIQAYIRVNHIIHGKVWNCRIQVFSKLVESEYPGFQFLHIGTDAPNLQWVWPQRHGNRKVQYLCSRKRTTVKEKKKNSCMNFFFFGNFPFFWELSFFFGQWWRRTPRSTRKQCRTGATVLEREQARRLIHGRGSNNTVNLICYHVTSTRD